MYPRVSLLHWTLLLATFVRLSVCAAGISPAVYSPASVVSAPGAIQTQTGNIFKWDPNVNAQLKVAANVRITMGDIGNPMSGCTIANHTANSGTCPYPSSCPSTGRFSIFIFALQESGTITNDQGQTGTYTVTIIIAIEEDFTGGCASCSPVLSPGGGMTTTTTAAPYSTLSPTSVGATSWTSVVTCADGSTVIETFIPITSGNGSVITQTVGTCSGGSYSVLTPTTSAAAVAVTSPSTLTTSSSYVAGGVGSVSTTITSTIQAAYVTSPSNYVVATTPSTSPSGGYVVSAGVTVNDAASNTPYSSPGTTFVPQVTSSTVGLGGGAATSPAGSAYTAAASSPYYTQAGYGNAGFKAQVPLGMALAGGLLGVLTFIFL